MSPGIVLLNFVLIPGAVSLIFYFIGKKLGPKGSQFFFASGLLFSNLFAMLNYNGLPQFPPQQSTESFFYIAGILIAASAVLTNCTRPFIGFILVSLLSGLSYGILFKNKIGDIWPLSETFLYLTLFSIIPLLILKIEGKLSQIEINKKELFKFPAHMMNRAVHSLFLGLSAASILATGSFTYGFFLGSVTFSYIIISFLNFKSPEHFKVIDSVSFIFACMFLLAANAFSELPTLSLIGLPLSLLLGRFIYKILLYIYPRASSVYYNSAFIRISLIFLFFLYAAWTGRPKEGY